MATTSCNPRNSNSEDSLLWKFICCLSLLVGFIAFIVAVVSFTSTYSTFYENFSEDSYPKSCKDVKSSSNGLQTIQSDDSLPPYQTYCEMESVDGGWTLVAAVHENNIEGKCTEGDKWSSEQGQKYFSRYNGTRNWQNLNLFGDINDLTRDDYKNSAYINLKASNVMIWHVPNNTPIKDIPTQAFLKYYTENSFLASYGSSLHALFSRYAPLETAGDYRYYNLVAPPVNYLVGNDNFIVGGIPTSQRRHIEAGFIQFRAFDERGFAYALCPGIKMTTGDPSRVCVGEGARRTSRTCGDFAGWGGALDDAGSENLPSSSGRASRDIRSSLLIFTK